MKILTIATLLFSIVLLAGFAFFGFIEIRAIKEKIKGINQVTEIKESKLPNWIQTTDSAINQAQMEKAFLLSQQEVSRSNSIALILNISDSLAALSIKGVRVHNAKIKAFFVDPLFNSVKPVALLNILARPLKIYAIKSSIKKVPLMVKIAPRDTSEYIPDMQADTLDDEEVNYVLQTSYGIQLLFNETNPDGHSGKINNYTSGIIENFMHNLFHIKNFVRKNNLNYLPKIQIFLSRKDAKAIYRAIPDTALMVLKIFP